MRIEEAGYTQIQTLKMKYTWARRIAYNETSGSDAERVPASGRLSVA